MFVHPVVPVLNETRAIVKAFNARLQAAVAAAQADTPGLKWLDMFDFLLSDDKEHVRTAGDGYVARHCCGSRVRRLVTPCPRSFTLISSSTARTCPPSTFPCLHLPLRSVWQGLRELCKSETMAFGRKMMYLTPPPTAVKSTDSKAVQIDKARISVLTYCILAQSKAVQTKFPYRTTGVLNWTHRSQCILK